MVQQILARGVDDPRLLEAILLTPRHLFVDEALWDRAYGDTALPIGGGQTISQPYIVARMIQLLELTPGERVLEVGTGSGYQAAIIARLSRAVYTIERVPALARRAKLNWARAGCTGILQRVGDGSLGWAQASPFDAILVGAAAPAVPPTLLRQLRVGGRMVIPVGHARRQVVKRLRRTADGAQVEDVEGCSFVRLVGREGFSE